MIIPIRCFSCGKPIGDSYEEYKKMLKDGKSAKEALDKLGIERFCCRSVMLSNVENIDTIAKFNN